MGVRVRVAISQRSSTPTLMSAPPLLPGRVQRMGRRRRVARRVRAGGLQPGGLLRPNPGRTRESLRRIGLCDHREALSSTDTFLSQKKGPGEEVGHAK